MARVRTNYPRQMIGNGMILSELEETIRLALSLTDAETRFEARRHPVDLVGEGLYGKYRITGSRIEGKTLVFTMDPEF